MEQAFRSLLISGIPDTPASRISWGEHTQDAGRPYIVLHLISVIQGHHMQGPEALEQSRVQVDCYAPTFGQVRSMAAAVKTALDFHSGDGFLGIFFDGMRQTRESGDAGEAIYRASLDFLTNWRTSNG